MFAVGAQIKNFFFDRAKVQSAIGKKKSAFLNHAGGYIRRVARNSIKLKGKAKKKNTTKLAQREAVQLPISAPGSPPFCHTDDQVATLRNIQYGVSPDFNSVVIGPLKLNAKSAFLGSSDTVPGRLERGGDGIIPEKKAGTKWVPMGRRKARPGQPTRKRQAHWRKRPYMGPALAKLPDKFSSLFTREGGAT